MEAFPVTSVKLRSQSISLTADTGEKTYADFFCFNGTIACVVMKDGSRVDILNQCLEKPIDLDQADYVLLPGDTKLPVPQTSETMNHTPCLSLWERWPSEAKTERENDGA